MSSRGRTGRGGCGLNREQGVRSSCDDCRACFPVLVRCHSWVAVLLRFCISQVLEICKYNECCTRASM